MRSTIFICLSFLLATFVCHADMYKWVDDNGKVTYSQFPPSDTSLSHEEITINSTEVDVDEDSIDVPLVDQPIEADQPTELDEYFSKQKQEKEAKEKADLAKKRNDAYCAQSKRAIEMLNLSGGHQILDISGEYKRLDEDEKAKLLSDHQTFVDENCGEKK